MDSSKKKCGACKIFKNADSANFNKTRDGFAAVCKQCSEKRIQKWREKKTQKAQAARVSSDSESEDEDSSDDAEEALRVKLGNVKMADFLREISSAENITKFTAIVELPDDLKKADARQSADGLANAIWSELKYRFVYGSALV